MNKNQTFDCHFEIKNLHVENGIGIIEGLASTFGNTDRVGDVIAVGAFTDTIEEIKARKGHIPMLWQHDSRVVIGKFRASDMVETNQGLFVKGEINLNTAKGKDAHELLKAEDVSDFSIGFRTLESEFDEVARVNVIEKVDLREISIVTFPANEEAVVTAVKSVVPFQDLPIARNVDGTPDTRKEWNVETAADNVLALAGDKDSEVFKSAFLELGEEEGEKVYKSQIADVIDGELAVVPRALFKAAAEVVISKSDTADHVKRNIERYYAKMDRESPFIKGISPDEVGCMSTKQIKTYLQNGGKFSRLGAERYTDLALKGEKYEKSLSDSGNSSPSDSGEYDNLMKSLKHKLGG